MNNEVMCCCNDIISLPFTGMLQFSGVKLLSYIYNVIECAYFLPHCNMQEFVIGYTASAAATVSD